MLNQVVLVGRLVRDLEVRTSDGDKKYSFITLAIPRSYKNHDGIYETDFIECILWNNIASNTAEYCKKGDIIGIKGRVESRSIEENNVNKNILQIIAEKVTFLSSKKQDNEET
ncbi:MAG: single-stranded DNA-binding protein [Bacilli bacterium]|nr:single-stranded DNA-binding protein [Bacilli bacterium]